MEWTTIAVLAVIVETVTEYLKTAAPGFANLPWAKLLVTFALGEALCFVCGADVLAALGLAESVPYIGTALTGLLVGGGSNIVYTLVKRIKGAGDKLAASLEIDPDDTHVSGHEDEGVM